MPPGRTRVTGRIIDAPFGKWTYGNNRVQGCRRCTHFTVVDLAFMACTDDKDAVLEDRRPEITSTENFLGGGISGHVATTSTGVVVTQHPLSLLESQTSAKNRISAEAVQGIANNVIGLRLVTNPPSSVFRYIRTEGRRLQIYYDVPIPRVEGAD